jgi:uncharacterized protein (DUF2267 family)
VALDYAGFIETVASAAHISRDVAERAARATLRTLGERITRGEADDIAAQLPPEAAPYLESTARGAEAFDVDEFVRRVAERAAVGIPDAERLASAVFLALGRALSPDEMDDLAAQLPRDILRLLPAGDAPSSAPASAFVERVAARAGLDHDLARRATDAVLETLAERIAGGEVDDLIAALPVELHPPLKRGKARTGGKATRMSLEEFVRRVAEREGAIRDDALNHARAVLTALRESVPDGEFYDITDQLPRDFDAVLPATGYGA